MSSLDIVAGAIGSCIFAGEVFHVSIPVAYLAVLGFSAWIIYSADHILDAIKKKGNTEIQTHKFFYKYKTPLILVTVILTIFTFRLTMYSLSPAIIQFGLVLVAGVIFYFLLVNFYMNAPKIFFIKELWISIIYTAGIWGGPVIYAGSEPLIPDMLLIASFFLLVFSNVLIYSYYEYNQDIREQEKSFAVDFGKLLTRRLIYFLLIISFVLWQLAVYIYGNIKGDTILIYSMITIFLVLIISFPGTFYKNERYGKLADSAFLIPYISIFI